MLAALLQQTPLELPVSESAESTMGVRLLAGGDGENYVSWVERTGDQSRLMFSKLDRETSTWGASKEIAKGEDWFVNWADYPVLGVTSGGLLGATWLQSFGREGSWDYGARISFSNDAGETWSAGQSLHDDDRGAEYGFVSLVPLGADGLGAVWLDSRGMSGSHGEAGDHGTMGLYFRRFDSAGLPGPELLIDGATCECCSTSALVDKTGAIRVAYRDRAADETRDMYLATIGGKLGFDRRPVYKDGWQIAGCPVNGPTLSANGDRLAMAWFTAAGGVPVVSVAESTDGGQTFAEPQVVDLGRPTGRALACYSDTGQLFVAWLELAPKGSDAGSSWMLRKVGSDQQPLKLAEVPSGRKSGFASLVSTKGGGLLFAWTRVDGEGATSVATIGIEKP